MSVVLPAVTSLIALFFALALLDQWRERRQPFQLVWALGMTFYGLASGCEAVAAAAGWNETLYRTWYLTGAVWTAGWLGLGTAYLLGRTRFGYAFAFSLFVAGLFTLLTQRRYQYEGAGSAPVLYFIAAGVLARGGGGGDVLPERALAPHRRPGGGWGDRREHRPDADHDAAAARLCR